MYVDVQAPRVQFRRDQMLPGPQGASVCLCCGADSHRPGVTQPLCVCVCVLAGQGLWNPLSAIIGSSHWSTVRLGGGGYMNRAVALTVTCPHRLISVRIEGAGEVRFFPLLSGLKQ